MIEQIKHFLLTYNKKTIELRQIQDVIREVKYEELAPVILQLMDDGVLVGMKEMNHQSPPLPKKFKLVTIRLKGDFFEQIRTLQLRRHPLIHLDAYYKLGYEALEEDLPWIEKIESYLRGRDLQQDQLTGIPLPEASFHMVGNEKWLEEEGGERVLKRIGLTWDALGLVSVPEPLMLALHPNRSHRLDYKHLIIENKTPFHALLGKFQEQTEYSTLIFGRGKMVLSSIQRFYQQTGLQPDANHRFSYFGDLDTEGIGIWYALSQEWDVSPDLGLYRELLQKPFVKGKENHRPNPQAVDAFGAYFTRAESECIKNMLAEGHYLPQEAVTNREWQAYWRGNDE